MEEFDFSTHTYNVLVRANIETVSQLVAKTEGDLMRLRGFGVKCLDEVKQKLQKRGLQLGQEMPVEEEKSSEPEKTAIDLLLERCNIGIEICSNIRDSLEEYRKEGLVPEFERYNEAKDNYLARENIFDPQGVVQAVRKKKEKEEKIYIDSGIADLDISISIYNCLKRRARINYIYELILMTEEEVQRIWRYRR